MSRSRKRSHHEEQQEEPAIELSRAAELIIEELPKLKEEKTRLRFLEQLRETPKGAAAMGNAMEWVHAERMRMKAADYFPDKIANLYKTYKAVEQQLESAANRTELEDETDADLILYRPRPAR